MLSFFFFSSKLRAKASMPVIFTFYATVRQRYPQLWDLILPGFQGLDRNLFALCPEIGVGGTRGSSGYFGSETAVSLLRRLVLSLDIQLHE
jgi:hypothetical protein